MTELIDRYVHEVGQNLPAKLRKDVEAELRSLLEDTVEDRAAGSGPKENEALVVAVLQEFGPPQKVAASYAPAGQYLIGPKLYPAFTRIMTVVLALLVILSAFNIARTLPESPAAGLPDLLLEAASTLLDSAFMLLGVAVVIFAVLERFETRETTAARQWDPRKLSPVSDPDRVSPSWLVGEIVVISSLLLLLNAFPQWVGVLVVTEEGSRFLPVLAPEFATHLPWLNGWLGLSLLLNLLVLRAGRWRPTSHRVDLGLNLVGIFVLYRLLTGAAIIGIVPDRAVLYNWSTTQLAQVQQSVIPIVSTLVDVTLTLLILAIVGVSVSKLYQLSKRKPASYRSTGNS